MKGQAWTARESDGSAPGTQPGDAKRPAPAKEQVKLIRGAYADLLAEMEGRSEALTLPDPATLDFIREVMKGMKARGELD